MKHTDAEIEEAASRFEVLADSLAPASVTADDLSDLRAIAEAAEQVRRDEALVTECVARARARGRSWNRIAVDPECARLNAALAAIRAEIQQSAS